MSIEKVCRNCNKFEVFYRCPVTYRVWQNKCYGPPPEPIRRTITRGNRTCSASGKNPIVSMGLEAVKCEVPDEFEPYKIKEIPKANND